MSSPLARGVTTIAVAGGALTLVAAAVPAVDDVGEVDEVPDRDAATILRLASPAELQPGQVLAPPPLEAVAADPDRVDADALVKSIERTEEALAEAERLAEEARIAEEQARQAAEEQARAAEERAAGNPEPDSRPSAPAPSTGSINCGLDTSGLGAVRGHVTQAAQFLGCQFGQPAMLGVGQRGGASDHPRGLALDLMTRGATGDAIAACALDNMDALGITYVIWKQRINHGSGWQGMADRGGDTANHYDHVHLSFASGGGSGDPRPC